MAKRAKPEVTFITDEFGTEVARLPVSNRPGQFCKMDRADWEAWCAAGRSQVLYVQPLGPDRFGLAYNDTLSGRAGATTMVARAIMSAPRNKAVFRRTSDILDMRRCNLVLRDRQMKARPHV